MKKLLLILMVLFCSSGLFSQNLPDIFSSTPKQLLRSRVLASFPMNTWLENLVTGADGGLYVTDYPEGKVFRVGPDGSQETYAVIGGKIAGIAVLHKKEFLVTGWDKDGKACIFRIDEQKNSGKLTDIDGGMFPNGILHFYDDQYLIADSFAGIIWLYDAATNKVSVWLKSELLERTSAKSQNVAANGLKFHGNDLYISNTEKQTILKVPVLNHKAGELSIYADKVNVDDFVFDDSGTIYAATNVYNTVISISPTKKVTIVADPSTGVAGSTALVFSTLQTGEKVLYVSTSGGMAVPPPTGVEQGKIIELFLK